MANNLFGSMVRGFGFTLGRTAATSLVNGLSRSSRASYDTYTPPSPYKTGGIQKLFIIVGWLWSIVYCIKTANTFPQHSEDYSNWGASGAICLALGWLPIWLFFRTFNYITISSKVKKEQEEQMIIVQQRNTEIQKQEKERLEMDEKKKNNLRPSITQMLTELQSYPFINLSLTSDDGSYDWNKSQHTATLEQMERIYGTLFPIIKTLKSYEEKGYDNDTICNIYNEELWLGMTEEHMKDMKGEPTKTEKETLRDGSIQTKHIYGNKISGDVLIFENDKLVSFKDR
jgi:hypothetical protein